MRSDGDDSGARGASERAEIAALKEGSADGHVSSAELERCLSGVKGLGMVSSMGPRSGASPRSAGLAAGVLARTQTGTSLAFMCAPDGPGVAEHGSYPARLANGECCRVRTDFVRECAVLAENALEEREGDEEIAMPEVGIDELAYMLMLFEASRGGPDELGRAVKRLDSTAAVAVLSAASYLGNKMLEETCLEHIHLLFRDMTTSQMCELLNGRPSDVPLREQAAILEFFAEPSIELLTKLQSTGFAQSGSPASAAEPEPEGGAAVGSPDGDTWGSVSCDLVGALMRRLSLRDIPQLICSSRSLCAMFFAPHAFAKGSWKTVWIEIFRGHFAPFAAHVEAIVDDGEGRTAEKRMDITVHLVWLFNSVATGHTDWEDAGAMGPVMAQVALFSHNTPEGEAARKLTPFLYSTVYKLMSAKKSKVPQDAIYAAVCEAAKQAVADACEGVPAHVLEGFLRKDATLAAEYVPDGAALLTRVVAAHKCLRATFQYLDKFYIPKHEHELATIGRVCEQSREALENACVHFKLVPLKKVETVWPTTPRMDIYCMADGVTLSAPVATETLVALAEAAGAETCLLPLQSSSEVAGNLVTWMDKSHSAVEDEDRRVWQKEFIDMLVAADGDGEAQQARLPLLFQTMEAANRLGVADLLDACCEHVAAMIAMRTPAEILDYFSIKKESTWEEDQALIQEHSWIDPDGLIAKDREKRLAEKAKETSE